MSLDALWPASWPSSGMWGGAIAALAASLAWAGLLRLFGRRDLAALGAGLGLAAGWAFTLGLPFASPRQLAERLPMLALAGFAAALVLSALAGKRAWLLTLGAGLCLAAGAWWLAGAPLAPADLRRALVLVLALGAASAVASLELRSPPRALAAFALMFAAIWILRPAGPWFALAAAGMGARSASSPPPGRPRGPPPRRCRRRSASPAWPPARSWPAAPLRIGPRAPRPSRRWCSAPRSQPASAAARRARSSGGRSPAGCRCLSRGCSPGIHDRRLRERAGRT